MVEKLSISSAVVLWLCCAPCLGCAVPCCVCAVLCCSIFPSGPSQWCGVGGGTRQGRVCLLSGAGSAVLLWLWLGMENGRKFFFCERCRLTQLGAVTGICWAKRE